MAYLSSKTVTSQMRLTIGNNATAQTATKCDKNKVFHTMSNAIGLFP